MANQLLHIGQIAEPARVGHARCQLKLHECGQVDVLNLIAGESNVGRIRKRDRFWFSIAWKITGHQKLNTHAMLGVAQAAATRKKWNISPALKLLMDCRQRLRRDEHVYILGET